MMDLAKNQHWQFSPIPNIEESNFNKILERFYNMKVKGLVRENIQNSMDGRLHESAEPVTVAIKIGKLKRADIPGIEEVVKRIESLKGRNSYTKEAIEHMRKKMLQDEVAYISFEDLNTRGLKGAENGQSDLKEDTWSIYAYNKGVHSEEEDEVLETARGGSHGVGKIASNAASDLNIMYFANCDAEGNQHLGGTVQLIEHNYGDQCYRSSGYFTKIKSLSATKTKFYPFENRFHTAFEKKTRGLKIIIPFLRDEYNDEKEVIRSVCESFFVSILQKKLEVVINNKKITHKTIRNYVESTEYYVQEMAEMKHEFTPLYVRTYSEVTPKTLSVSDGVKDYEFALYFRYDESIPKGRVAIVRTIGMKIEDKKITGHVNKPFNAVLIGGPAEDGYLKSLENESHTELSHEHIKDPILKKQAKKFINNLSKQVAAVVEEAMRQKNPTDGLMNTKDILYTVENEFKQELAGTSETVMINKGKSVLKMTDTVPKKKRKAKSNKGNGEEKPKDPKPVRKVKPRNPVSEEDDQNKAKERYITQPGIVKRIVVGNREMIQFNFKDSKEINKEPSCNISLSVIDGMGVEYTDEFKVKGNYHRVIDTATGRECLVKDNVIQNVTIRDGLAQMQLELNSNFNKALKFIYYVEV
ncbi:hypothetical protein [Niallia taxi]|uniref:hypothetical protein n=1 Tax=Niallia taxi TaxID=2499688 RepID=UPI00300ADC10